MCCNLEIGSPNRRFLTQKSIRMHHDFVQRQGNPPECQRFEVHDEACRVMDVANL